MKLVAGVMVLLLSACGSTSATTGSPSSSASSSPSSAPVVPAVAVVEWDQDGTGYTLRLVSADARVLASVHATWTNSAKCGPVEAGIISPPPVSTSNTRAYYLDSGGMKWLMEDGKTGVAFGALQQKPNVAVGFSVAPDDSEFALNTIDYTASPLTQHLTVTPVGASALGTQIFSARSPGTSPTAAVWPVGWHAGDIALAYHRGTCTQGGGPGLGDATSYHVVNASTAARTATIGSDSGSSCGLLGLPTPAGIPCGDYSTNRTRVLSWTGATGRTYAAAFEPGGLSPNGGEYAGTDATNSTSAPILKVILAGGSTFTVPGGILSVMWIDDSHFFVGPEQQGTGQVYSTVPQQGTLKGTPVQAAGTPLARIPATLETGAQ